MTSKLIAPGHRVIVKPDQIKKKTESGIIVVRDDEERDHQLNTSTGRVISLGPTCWMAYDYWKPDGKRNEAWAPWCAEGDRIVYAKYAGKWIKSPTELDEDGKPVEYVVINDQDVVMVVTEDTVPHEE